MYYFDESFNGKNKAAWLLILEHYISNSDYVEFNQLFDYDDNYAELLTLESDLVGKNIKEDKLYNFNSVRYNLSENVVKFILSKNYKDWYNYIYEDISFRKANREIFGTITHHNYIVAEMSEKERELFNMSGFNFAQIWGEQIDNE